MFDLMPFEHKTRNIANFFDTFEKTFFNDFPAGFSEIRTDILDKGDRYVLQACLLYTSGSCKLPAFRLFLNKASVKNFSRLRREQRVWRCVDTSCAANSGGCV